MVEEHDFGDEVPDKVMRERRETINFNVKNCPKVVYDKFVAFANKNCAGYFALAISKLLDYRDYSVMAHTLANRQDSLQLEVNVMREELDEMKDNEEQEKVEQPRTVGSKQVLG